MEETKYRLGFAKYPAYRKYGGGEVMVWGCMAASGVGEVVFIDGTMDKFVIKTSTTKSEGLSDMDNLNCRRNDNFLVTVAKKVSRRLGIVRTRKPKLQEIRRFSVLCNDALNSVFRPYGLRFSIFNVHFRKYVLYELFNILQRSLRGCPQFINMCYSTLNCCCHQIGYECIRPAVSTFPMSVVGWQTCEMDVTKVEQRAYIDSRTPAATHANVMQNYKKHEVIVLYPIVSGKVSRSLQTGTYLTVDVLSQLTTTYEWLCILLPEAKLHAPGRADWLPAERERRAGGRPIRSHDRTTTPTIINLPAAQATASKPTSRSGSQTSSPQTAPYAVEDCRPVSHFSYLPMSKEFALRSVYVVTVNGAICRQLWKNSSRRWDFSQLMEGFIGYGLCGIFLKGYSRSQVCEYETPSAMSSQPAALPIEHLKGRENYYTWKFAVQEYLEYFWDCVTGTDTDAKRNTKCRSKLILLVDPLNYVHIQNTTTAKATCENLQKVFQDDSLTRKIGLLRILITTKLDESGLQVSDEWTGAILLTGLPSKYQPMIMGIESSGIRVTGDSIKAKLLQDITSVKSELPYDEDDSALYSCSSKRTFHRNSNSSSNDRISGKTYQNGPRCYECNRYGHISRNCDQVTSRKNTNKPSNSTKSMFASAFSMQLPSQENVDWYLDSCASVHIYSDSRRLENSRKASTLTITTTNNNKIVSDTAGNMVLPVSICGNTSDIQVSDIYRVPDSQVNLLSVGRIVLKGNTVEFDNKGGRVYNSANQLIATATLVDGIFKLDVPSTDKNANFKVSMLFILDFCSTSTYAWFPIALLDCNHQAYTYRLLYNLQYIKIDANMSQLQSCQKPNFGPSPIRPLHHNYDNHRRLKNQKTLIPPTKHKYVHTIQEKQFLNSRARVGADYLGNVKIIQDLKPLINCEGLEGEEGNMLLQENMYVRELNFRREGMRQYKFHPENTKVYTVQIICAMVHRETVA
ncbi:hypothetical protein PR048_015073 [Dryococelus australis]|uniref:CCHC-type domain-containing protein n=1 Tax=Dryococelus australis TaxID=614101 RepID=A0ABQ9HFZ2_9NEOP|nr:hypothetical protein PR048_015073 [Dryococelus australis]